MHISELKEITTVAVCSTIAAFEKSTTRYIAIGGLDVDDNYVHGWLNEDYTINKTLVDPISNMTVGGLLGRHEKYIDAEIDKLYAYLDKMVKTNPVNKLILELESSEESDDSTKNTLSVLLDIISSDDFNREQFINDISDFVNNRKHIEDVLK